MGLFNYNTPGKGISKEDVKKTGAARFFDLLGRKLWRIAGINMLYYIFYIPIMLIPVVLNIPDDLTAGIVVALLLLIFAVTIGPATAGMTKLMRCFIIEKHCFLIRDFFSGFRQNFKKAAVIGVLDCVAIISAIGSVRVYPALAVQLGTKLMYVCMVLSLSIALVFFLMNFYIYLMLVATNLSLKNLFKNSFALAFVSMKSNLISAAFTVLFVGIMFVVFCFVPALFLIIIPFFPAALISFIICYNSYPIIQKYVINPYYTSIGEINPELIDPAETSDEETLFEDMGGKEQPITKENSKKRNRT